MLGVSLVHQLQVSSSLGKVNMGRGNRLFCLDYLCDNLLIFPVDIRLNHGLLTDVVQGDAIEKQVGGEVKL